MHTRRGSSGVVREMAIHRQHGHSFRVADKPAGMRPAASKSVSEPSSHPFTQVIRSGPGFVNYVERRFRRSAETAEARRGYHFSDARLSGLRAQAKTYFLRS